MCPVSLFVALSLAACNERGPERMVPKTLQARLAVEPPGGAIHQACVDDGFSEKTLRKFRREGRSELRALRTAFRRYPERGVVVRYDGSEEDPRRASAASYAAWPG